MKIPKFIKEGKKNPEIQAIKANNVVRMNERYQTILLNLHGVSKRESGKS